MPGARRIDAAGTKNLVGTFHMPSLVVADPSLLGTLDARQLRSGYAEVVKYGLIDDPDFFIWCEDHGSALIAGDGDARLHAITHCIRAKARIVATDPLDTNGQRALLNLGHSFGHAIEATAGIGQLLHGEAVAIGLLLASSYRRCWDIALTAKPSGRTSLASVGLPFRLDQVGLAGKAGALIGHMRQDKKAGKDAWPLSWLTASGGPSSIATLTGTSKAFGFALIQVHQRLIGAERPVSPACRSPVELCRSSRSQSRNRYSDRRARFRYPRPRPPERPFAHGDRASNSSRVAKARSRPLNSIRCMRSKTRTITLAWETPQGLGDRVPV